MDFLRTSCEVCMDAKMLHVGIPATSKKSAYKIFQDLFDLQLKKTFFLSPQLSDEIFGIHDTIEALVFEGKQCTFEIFILHEPGNLSVHHCCIELDDKTKFLQKCKDLNISVLFIQKPEKTLIFIKDDAGNLFEMKFRSE